MVITTVRSKSIVIILLSFLFLVSATILSGCSAAKQTTSSTTAKKPQVINASYVSRPINVPSIVAKNKQLFEQEFSKDGIKFQWHDLSDPSNQLEALASKSLDFANSLNYVSVILAKAHGNDLKIISAYSRFPKGISLVVNPQENIKTIQDLKGKKIALQKGTMLHEMLIRALAQANLTAEDLEIVDMDSTAGAAALASGQVDATILPEPLLTKAVAAGKAKKLISAEGLIPGLSVIAVRSDFAASYPDIVKRYLAIHQSSLDWTQSHLSDALALAASENKMGLPAVKALYPEFSFAMSLDQVKSDLLKSAEFLQSQGMIKQNVDLNKLVNDLVDPNFLPAK
ncbi:ABC transporter substrate-binding protein [Desulfosporosinus sp. SYSU MS00001]|uniref:ABC transporter substrate-binding protein n=1 Tax=Desulfosporosinus sp. SYSU MS00001 TaxID=3416284 RepID=UPI003CF73F69